MNIDKEIAKALLKYMNFRKGLHDFHLLDREKNLIKKLLKEFIEDEKNGNI